MVQKKLFQGNDESPLGRTRYPGGLPGHAAGSETSKEAAKIVAADLGKRQLQVLMALCREQSSTADGLCRVMRRQHNSVAPRLTELKKLGLVRETGEVVETRSGGHGKILEPTDDGWAVYDKQMVAYGNTV